MFSLFTFINIVQLDVNIRQIRLATVTHPKSEYTESFCLGSLVMSIWRLSRVQNRQNALFERVSFVSWCLYKSYMTERVSHKIPILGKSVLKQFTILKVITFCFRSRDISVSSPISNQEIPNGIDFSQQLDPDYEITF